MSGMYIQRGATSLLTIHSLLGKGPKHIWIVHEDDEAFYGWPTDDSEGRFIRAYSKNLWAWGERWPTEQDLEDSRRSRGLEPMLSTEEMQTPSIWPPT